MDTETAAFMDAVSLYLHDQKFGVAAGWDERKNTVPPTREGSTVLHDKKHNRLCVCEICLGRVERPVPVAAAPEPVEEDEDDD